MLVYKALYVVTTDSLTTSWTLVLFSFSYAFFLAVGKRNRYANVEVKSVSKSIHVDIF